MSNFYFCNFLGNSMARRCRKGVTEVSVSDRLSEKVQLAKAYLVDNNGSLKLELLCEDEASMGKEIDLIGEFNCEDKRVKSSSEELQHTEENPIIFVATEKFKVFNGVPTYIKYIPVKDGVLVALIKGCILVQSAEGDMIPLSRNYPGEVVDKGRVLNARDIHSLNALSDKDSEVLYSDYVVNDCIIFIETTKDGRDVSNLKFSRNHFVYLYKEVFEEAKAEKERKIQLAKEARERKAEENAKFAMVQAAKQRRLEEEKKAKKKTSSKPKEEKIDDIEDADKGAKSFLDFVNSIKK